MHPANFRFIWQSGLTGKDFLEINQSETKNCLWRPCLLTDRDEMSNRNRIFHGCFLPSIGSFGQTVSEEKNLKKISQSETKIACGGHVC